MTYKFVPYDKKHLKSCVQLVRETWDLHSKFQNIKNIDLVYLHYFKNCLDFSIHTELILDDSDTVVGVMLGSIENGGFLKFLKSNSAYLLTSLKSLFSLLKGDFGDRKIAWDNMKKMSEIDSKGEAHSDKFDSEVNLFIVSKKHRGKKLGYTLMNNYLDFCNNNGLKNCFLWTDLGCSYSFYERYGFKLLEKFHSKNLTQGDKSSPNGMIYYLDLKEYFSRG